MADFFDKTQRWHEMIMKIILHLRESFRLMSIDHAQWVLNISKMDGVRLNFRLN